MNKNSLLGAYCFPSSPYGRRKSGATSKTVSVSSPGERSTRLVPQRAKHLSGMFSPLFVNTRTGTQTGTDERFLTFTVTRAPFSESFTSAVNGTSISHEVTVSERIKNCLGIRKPRAVSHRVIGELGELCLFAVERDGKTPRYRTFSRNRAGDGKTAERARIPDVEVSDALFLASSPMSIEPPQKVTATTLSVTSRTS